MTVEDLDTVISMEQELQLHPWPREAFLQAMGYGQHCPVYEEGGMITGYGIADGGHGRTIAARSMKAAGHIYRAWFDHAQAVGAPLLWAEIESQNAAARVRLERFGFTKAGVRPSFYGAGIDAEVWTKSREDQNS